MGVLLMGVLLIGATLDSLGGGFDVLWMRRD